MTLQPARLSRVLISHTTLGVFALLGAAVAFAEWGILPDAARIVAAPALAAALLFDTFLYNEFLVRTGPWVWLVIYAFLYVQAALIGTVIRKLRQYSRESVAA